MGVKTSIRGMVHDVRTMLNLAVTQQELESAEDHTLDLTVGELLKRQPQTDLCH